MRSSHNTTTATPHCTKCLASIQVALINQGLDLARINRFIEVSIFRHQQEFELLKETMSIDQRMEEHILYFNLNSLRSLLARCQSNS